MQASKDIDWPLIQTLYTSGLGPKEISAKTGVKPDTIASRASRFCWRALMAKAKPIMQVAIQGDSDDEAGLASQSQRARKALGDILVRSAEKLASMPIRTPSTALRVNQDAESMVRNAKTVFGWSESQAQPAVRINILSNTTVASTPVPLDDKPIIDVS